MSALYGVGPLLDRQRQPCLLPLTPKLGSSHDSHAPCMVRVMAALLLWFRGSFVWLSAQRALTPGSAPCVVAWFNKDADLGGFHHGHFLVFPLALDASDTVCALTLAVLPEQSCLRDPQQRAVHHGFNGFKGTCFSALVLSSALGVGLATPLRWCTAVLSVWVGTLLATLLARLPGRVRLGS